METITKDGRRFTNRSGATITFGDGLELKDGQTCVMRYTVKAGVLSCVRVVIEDPQELARGLEA